VTDDEMDRLPPEALARVEINRMLEVAGTMPFALG